MLTGPGKIGVFQRPEMGDFAMHLHTRQWAPGDPPDDCPSPYDGTGPRICIDRADPAILVAEDWLEAIASGRSFPEFEIVKPQPKIQLQPGEAVIPAKALGYPLRLPGLTLPDTLPVPEGFQGGGWFDIGHICDAPACFHEHLLKITGRNAAYVYKLVEYVADSKSWVGIWPD